MKIIREICPNPDYLVLHMDRKLAVKEQYSFTTQWGYMKDINIYPWLKEIQDINGVLFVNARDYEISVMKGRVFSFETIIPAVETILQREFPDNLA